MRRAARTDANHTEIVRVFRRCGFNVHDTSRVGHGFPDLVVYRPSHGLVLIEVKDGEKPPSERRLTPAEADFGTRFPVRVVQSVEDVFNLAGDSELWRKHI